MTGDQKTIAALVRKVARLDDSSQRRAAAAAVPPLDFVTVALPLQRELLESSPYQSAVSDAVYALDQEGGLGAVEEPLLAILDEGPDKPDRWSDLVGLFGRAGKLDRIARKAAEGLLGDDNGAGANERRSVLPKLLRDATDEAVWAGLVARARADRNRTREAAPWRERVLDALGDNRARAALARPSLLLALTDEAPFVVEAALAPVRNLGEEARPYLEQAARAGLFASRAVGALGMMGAEAAAPFCLEMLSNDSFDVRREAARVLWDARHPAAYAAMASLWAAADTAGLERWDCWDRKTAAERMEVPLKRQIDWLAALRARGLESLPVRPFPSPLEMLSSADERVRRAGFDLIARAHQPQHLFAVALANELFIELGRRGWSTPMDRLDDWDDFVRARPQLWEEWRALSRYPLDRAAWVRAHLAELAPQELTPGLERLRDKGAAAFADGLTLRLPLDPSLRARLDAEEAAIAERALAGGLPVAAPASPIVAAEPARAPQWITPAAALVEKPASGALAWIDVESTRLRWMERPLESDDLIEVAFGWGARAGVEMRRVWASLADAAGRTLAVDDRSVDAGETHLEAGKLLGRIVDKGIVGRARRLDGAAELDVTATFPLGIAECSPRRPPDPVRAEVPLRFKAVDGPEWLPRITAVRLDASVDPEKGDLIVFVAIESRGAPLFEGRAEVRIVARDSKARVIGEDHRTLSVGASGPSPPARFWIGPHDRAAALDLAQLELSVTARARHVIRLGSLDLE